MSPCDGSQQEPLAGVSAVGSRRQGGIACGAQGGGLPAPLEEVALPVHLKDVDAVSEAAQECTGKPLRAEDLGPLVEGRLVVTRTGPLS